MSDYTKVELEKTLEILNEDLATVAQDVFKARDQLGKIELTKKGLQAQIGLITEMLNGNVKKIIRDKTIKIVDNPIEGQEDA